VLLACAGALLECEKTQDEWAMVDSVKLLHTARTKTTGGREYGAARSSDGLLDIMLSIPGSERIGANPEQLLAVAWSASFESAIAAAACQRAIVLPFGLAIEAEIDLCLAAGAGMLRARLKISLPGMARELSVTLIDDARQICAYSNATRGNVDVDYKLL
jgi:lipoyl-dependent peroxiredoxin